MPASHFLAPEPNATALIRTHMEKNLEDFTLDPPVGAVHWIGKAFLKTNPLFFM